MKKKQLGTMAIALSLTLALGVGATLAIMSQQSNVVTNTFAVGTGIGANALTLFEHDKADEDKDNQDHYRDNEGTVDGELIDISGVAYNNLEPNMTLAKDPAVQISKGTADCYLFVSVEDAGSILKLNGVTADGIYGEGNPNWIPVEGVEGMYYYTKDGSEKIVTADGMKVTEPLFTKIDLGNDADLYNEDGTGKELKEIVVKAVIVQATETDNWDTALATAQGILYNETSSTAE